MNKILRYIPLFIVSLFFLSGCEIRKPNKSVVLIKGSDTMVNLALRWAEEYMKLHEGVSIQVTGGGSGNGVAALLNGTAQIATLSRELKASEQEKAKQLMIEPIMHKVALDGIAVIVHPDNPVDTLSLDQLKNIFSGVTNNWADVGGNNSEIILYGRENSSGTYEYFKQTVLNKDSSNYRVQFANNKQVLQGTSALAEAIAQDENGIGYGGVGYFAQRNDVKVVYVKKSGSDKAVIPLENGSINYKIIWSGKYPLSRYLYFYTDGKPNGHVRGFIDFVLSKEGQKIVEMMEYIPLQIYKIVPTN